MIKEHFIDEEGIKCPKDGLIALSIKELKIIAYSYWKKYFILKISHEIIIFKNKVKYIWQNWKYKKFLILLDKNI